MNDRLQIGNNTYVSLNDIDVISDITNGNSRKIISQAKESNMLFDITIKSQQAKCYVSLKSGKIILSPLNSKVLNQRIVNGKEVNR